MHKMLKRQSFIRRTLRSKWFGSVVTGGGSAVAAIIAALRYLSHPDDIWIVRPLVGTALLLLLYTGLKAWNEYMEEREAVSTEPMECALQTLASILENGDVNHGLRVCVYVREGKDKLRQLTNYVGTERGGRDRIISIYSGIVGMVFRLQKAKVAISNLPENRQLPEFLVQEFNYLDEDAQKCKSDRKSWAAAPIGADGNVVAAIFCDSSVRNFFKNHPQNFRKKALQLAILGIAKYLDAR